ncbi:lamin tail domain-containing protein, partial [Bacteroidota bacterium]
NNKSYITFTVQPKPSEYNDIVFNELMYKPTNDEPEWLEIFNRTDSTMDLRNWSISDINTNLIITTENLKIKPKNYVVLSDDESIRNLYSIESLLIITNLPSLNNTGDKLKLLDQSGLIIDSIHYLPSWGGNKNGKSLERIDVDWYSNDSTNWGSSISKQKATPGIINSISRKDFDVAISEVSFTPPKPIINENVVINSTIKNIGLEIIEFLNVEIYFDSNIDSIGQNSERIISENYSNLEFGDSLKVQTVFNPKSTGNKYFIAMVNTDIDQYLDNNISFFNFRVNDAPLDFNSVVINEIMYKPNSEEPEWIELYNRTNKNLNIKGWSFSDKITHVILTEQDNIFNANSFLIISEDESIYNFYDIPSKVIIKNIPSLNNQGDNLKIYDDLTNIIDSVNYLSHWGNQTGKSLERINPLTSSNDELNWGNSESELGSTPGLNNSITKKDIDLAAIGLYFDPKKPMVGDDVIISMEVINKGYNNVYFDLILYEDSNLDTIANNLLDKLANLYLNSGDTSLYQFSYKIYNITSERGYIGQIKHEYDETPLNNETYNYIFPGYLPNTIIINEIMYNPLGGEPEWIEFYNITDLEVDLKNWNLSDILKFPQKKIISENNFRINPKTFFIVSVDSSIYKFHSSINVPLKVVPFANLNNDEDGIIIKDGHGFTIDSIKYSHLWGGTEGYSLERISKSDLSTYANNWQSSTDPHRSTPGRINSVSTKQYDLIALNLFTIPDKPIINNEIKLVLITKNIGKVDASIFEVSFYLGQNKNKELIENFLYTNLSVKDSIITETNNTITLNDNQYITAEILYPLDEDTVNNSLIKHISPSYKTQSVLITEFLNYTDINQVEWIELINISQEKINLFNWDISDKLPSKQQSIITNKYVFIYPMERFLITRDSSNFNQDDSNSKIFEANFGSLGNFEDGIIISDLNGNVIDSLIYTKNWKIKKGRSIERISLDESSSDSSNWISTINPAGGSPGSPNSIINIPNYNFNDLIINEIMYEPDSDNSEFIEIFNPSNEFINIGGWSFIDGSGKITELKCYSYEIAPNNYFILTADSVLFLNYEHLDNNDLITITNDSDLGLSNEGELLLVKDLWENTIDSIAYNPNWHNKQIKFSRNKSLERINPYLNSQLESNWSTSVNELGATPGETNSIFLEKKTTVTKLSITPNPFSPDNDGYEDFTLITYNLSFQIAQIRIKIFDDRGRLVRSLISNKSSGSNGSVIFDGLDDDGFPLRIGMYIVFHNYT